MKAITLDPQDPFERVIIEMVGVNRVKRADYAGASDNVFQNFYDSAYQLGQSAGHSVEQLIGTKQSRLRTLLPMFWSKKGRPKNEGIRDTLVDRAVYSVISVGIWDEQGYDLS